MGALSDTEAIKKIKEGEIEYFSEIVKGYTRPVLAFVSKMIFDKTEVEDIVQNSFIQFYKHIHKFDESRPVLPYLFQIAKNEARMYMRSKKSTLSLSEHAEIAAEEDIHHDPDIEALVDSLPPDQKKAIQLLYEGHSYKEIAATLKRPLNTVRTIIRRTRLLLKQKQYGKT